MRLLDLRAERITALQQTWTHQWHDAATPPEGETPRSQIEQNHRMNFALWHEEDIARRDDLGAERIRQAKRTIDRCNQSRNDAVEQIDAWIAEQLPSRTEPPPVHSETPGMMIDRLSILALKQYHMAEEVQRETADEAHRQQCRIKLERIQCQLADLRDCLEILLQQLVRGERTFKLYKQFKMYNDPALNPQLYQNLGMK
ncbi:MAG TPA: DUF4254 domain-containing protein [Chthonomonadaceae bacterium]|nr:DUF4254 domain-containing protein [Chthonomonadaceae bacterium]